jgi:membrane dipeptidase
MPHARMTRACIGICCAAWIAPCAAPVRGETSESLETRAARIHEQILTIDTHVDTPMRMLGGKFDIGRRHDPRPGGGQVDLPRMAEGGLDAVFFAVFLSQGERTPEGNERARQRTMRLFQVIHEAVERHSELAGLALRPEDAYRLKNEGRRAIYLGIENGYAIGQDLELLATYHDLGARYITLCHSRNNDICDSSTDPTGPEHDGLSEFGAQVVREMNRLGMMIDVSHISDKAFYDVLDISRAPVIASHSCARALCDHPRNLDDAMLRALAERGGVIQICVLDAYVKPSRPHPERADAIRRLRQEYGDAQELSEARHAEMVREWEEIDARYPRSDATASDVVDHIDHVVNVAGIDHVGIGTDFDGGGGLRDLQDVSELGNITLELVRRGYDEHQIAKIWSENFLRVFRETERVAEQIGAQGTKRLHRACSVER